jgi:hypothetical protein
MPGHTGYYDDEGNQQDQRGSKPPEKKLDEET